jgi:hypothetical protein
MAPPSLATYIQRFAVPSRRCGPPQVLGEIELRTYSLYIQDARYSVATLDFADAADEAAVRRIARQRLEASPDHLSIEVWADEVQVFRLTREELKPK